jgi:hypothetical protein
MEEKNSPIDRWLALGAMAIGIALFILPKSPAIVVGLWVVIFVLLLHPCWHLPWIKNKSLRIRLVVCGILALVCAMLGYLSWPSDDNIAVFHVVGFQVARSSQNLHQLIANITIQNDGGNAQIVCYGATFVAKSTDDEKERGKLLKELQSLVQKYVREGGGLKFTVRPKESRWFTNFGPILTDEQIAQYRKGDFTFYFAGSVIITESKITKSLDYCSFVIGNNPNAILSCPSTPY